MTDNTAQDAQGRPSGRPSNLLSSESDEQLLAKVRRRLLPILCLASAFAYLDRISIAVLAEPMSAEIGLTSTAFGFAAGLFFLGYFVAEIPSNVALHRFGGRRWIARIMLTWGLITIATMFVSTAWVLYLLRFMLGLAEAGLFPGVILYCTYWFPRTRLGPVYAIFITSIPIAFASTSLIVSAILQMDGLAGLSGWQWAFLLTGLPPVILAAVVWRKLPDRPESAPAWLAPEEQQRLTEWVAAEAPPPTRASAGRQVLLEPVAWFYAFSYFCIVIGFWSYTFWLPQTVAANFSLGPASAGALSAIPWVFGLVTMVVIGKLTEHLPYTRWIQVGCLVVGGMGMALAAAATSVPVLAFVGLCLAAGGILSASAQFWTQPTARFAGAVGAVAFALINSVGNLGGFVGPYAIGILDDAFGSTRAGLYLLAGFLFIAAVCAFARSEGLTKTENPAPATS